MKNIHPLMAKRRLANRIERLGSNQPICLLCGCNEPMLLRPIRRPFAEKHHVVGQEHDALLTLSLCFNCHALITEGLHKAGVSMKREPNPTKFAQIVFGALAVHFEMLSDAFWRFESLSEKNHEKRKQ